MTIEIYHWADDKPEGFDVTDFFENGGKKSKFSNMIMSAELFEIEKQREQQLFNRTDAGNAELFKKMHESTVKYEHQSGKYFIWNGQFWESDTANNIQNKAIETARFWKKLALNIDNPNNAQEIFRHGLKSENHKKLECMLKIAKSLRGISTLSHEWNQNPFLLQFKNGTLNLKTMVFLGGKQSDLISQCVGFDYDKKAKYPQFMKAIREIFNNDWNLIKFIQRAVGYSLTGDVSEGCFFILHGSGSNGKTVILEIIKLLLGDYALNSSFSAFEKKYYYTQSNDIARLKFARLVTASESRIDKQFDEERLKSITGKDSITARFLHKEYFTFKPRFKLWLGLNTLPSVSDFSYGFWRRVRVIPCHVLFEGKNNDKHIDEKLAKELPGIMNWALEGLRQWIQTGGLNPPQKVIQATKSYRDKSDVVKEFLDGFVVKDSKKKIGAKELYDNYCAWYGIEYSDPPISQAGFGVRVTLSTGIKSKAYGKKRRKTYIGLGMKDNFPYNSKKIQKSETVGKKCKMNL
ncbi:MAG: hypothetical protein ISS29_06580 [Candidatus Marinimicrobia bacterium]|nr:hypothetical protein [Candidatus Neomarinimicrobiota bacterium]